MAPRRRRLAPALIVSGVLALGACGSGGSGAHASDGFHALVAQPTAARNGSCGDGALKGADHNCYRVADAAVGTDAVETAQPGTGTGGANVSMVFTSSGVTRFNDLAAACVARGKDCPVGRIALVVDDEVMAAPMISTPALAQAGITISGALTSADARRVARALTAN